MRKIFLIILGMLGLSLMFHAGFALSITPGRYDIPYEPGKQYDLTFQISGEYSPTDINITVRGDMLDGIVLENQIIHLDAGVGKIIDVNFTVPADLTPGRHEAQLLAAELPPANQHSGLAAVVAVVGQIRVFAPYPNKYAEISNFNTQSVSAGQTAVFSADLTNYGSQDIQSIAGTVDIFDIYTNESIASVPIDVLQNVPTGSGATLYAEWDTTGVKAGTYHVETNAIYDGITANQLTTNLRVGNKFVKIVNISAQNITSGSINKVSVDTRSEWNLPLQTYAQFVVSSGQTTVADVSSPTVTLGPWSSATFDAYIDATNVLPGTYDLKTIIHYEDNTTENSAQIIIAKKTGSGIAGINMPSDQLAILALVILVIAFGLLIARKKRKGRRATQQYWPRYG